MLLTAQRVVSPTGERGVNVYRYHHGAYVWARVPNEFLPDVDPGELSAQWLQVAPGNNGVVSFLDVVAPDEVAALDLHQRLASLKFKFQPVGVGAHAYWDPYWMRFGTATTPSFWQTEVGALAGLAGTSCCA